MSEREPGSALVTGGGGGLGSAIAAELAGLGYEVIIAGRDTTRLGRLAAEHPRMSALQLDVTSEPSWLALLDRVQAELPPLDVVVTSAGVISRAPFLDSDVEQWQAMLQTNVVGTMLALRNVLPGMVGRGFGRAICISSVAAAMGCDNRAVYGATKGAVEALCRGIAVELAGTGVTINCLAPGAFRTEFNADYLEPGTPTGDAALSAIPEGRFGVTSELGAAVRYLVDAAYSQGATVRLDGGWSIHG